MASTAPPNRTAVPTQPDWRNRRPSERPGEPFPLARRQRAKLPFPRDIPVGTFVALVAVLAVARVAIELIFTHGLSVEEILAAGQAQRSLGGLISGLAGGVQPPLQPLLDWLMVHIFGGGDFALRFPSLVAGVALIPSVAALARELFDRRTAVVAALFTSVAPALVWYSQEVSPYSLVALFGTLTVLGAVRARKRGEPRDWALYTFAAALAVWSSWSGILIVAAGEAILLERVIRVRRADDTRSGEPDPHLRRFVRGWALATLALACQLVPLGVLFADQLHSASGLAGVATVGASGVSFYTSVSNVSWGLFGFHPAVVTDAFSAVWPLGMLASLLMIGRRLSGRTWLLLLCAVIPALGTLALGVLVPGAFDVRYAVAGVPPAMVLAAAIAVNAGPARIGRLLVAVGVAAVLIGALIDQQIDANNPRRYDYGPALAQVQRQAGRDVSILYEPAELGAVFAREAPALHARPLGRRLPTQTEARGVVLVTSFTGRPAVRALLNRDLGALRATRRLVSYRAYPGVEVWQFEGWRFR